MCFYATRASSLFILKLELPRESSIKVLQIFFILQSGKLTEAERKEKVEFLLTKGWTIVTGRDAIYKEITFKDFNQVRLQKTA